MTDTTTSADAEQDTTTQAGDLIPRSEAQRAFEARDAAKLRVRELEDRATKLEAKLAEARKSPTKSEPTLAKSGDEAPPAWAQQMMDRQAALEAQISGKTKAEHRSRIVDSILAKVPEGNRALAAVTIDGLVARGTLQLEGDDPTATADAAASLLRTQHAALFAVAGSTGSAIQVGPDGKIDWNSVQSQAEVPAGAWADMPDDVFQRLSSGAGNGTGLLIRGGR